MLLTLWLYAISRGIGSARELARLVASDDGFRWIAGDQQARRTVLSEFRVTHEAALDKLFTDVLGVLLHKGLLSLELAAQDGPGRRRRRFGARLLSKSAASRRRCTSRWCSPTPTTPS